MWKCEITVIGFIYVTILVNKYSNIIYLVVLYSAVDSIFYVSQIILVDAKIVIWGYCATAEMTVFGVIIVKMVFRKNTNIL